MSTSPLDPNREDIEAIAAERPNTSDAERYRLAKERKLYRISEARSPAEFALMGQDGRLAAALAAAVSAAADEDDQRR